MKKINIYVFNVNEGESIIVEIVAGENKYIVIDCNLIYPNKQKTNPAYNFLKSKNVEKISSLIITHFHKDHYDGIEDILNNFEISKIIIPPFLSSKSKQYNKIINAYREKVREVLDRTNDNEVVQSAKSLTFLLKYICENGDKVEEASGKESILRLPTIDDLEAYIYLPLKKITSVLHSIITDDDFSLNHFPKMNDSSIAIALNCFGHKVLLSGDSTIEQWREHKRLMARDNINNLGIELLSAPHHGSKYDNTENLYNYLLTPDKLRKFLFISAEGNKNPAKEIFDLISKYELYPYCTNISPLCLPSNIKLLKQKPNLPSKIIPFIRNYIEDTPFPCQGDIIVSIDPIKEVDISSSTNFPCVYRGSN